MSRRYQPGGISTFQCTHCAVWTRQPSSRLAVAYTTLRQKDKKTKDKKTKRQKDKKTKRQKDKKTKRQKDKKTKRQKDSLILFCTLGMFSI